MNAQIPKSGRPYTTPLCMLCMHLRSILQQPTWWLRCEKERRRKSAGGGTRLPRGCVRVVAHALTCAVQVDASDRALGDAGAVTISSALVSNRTMTKVSLSGDLLLWACCCRL